jgi:ribonuclease PH
MAVRRLMKEGLLQQNPIKDGLCAISIGINSKSEIIADLNYEEDSSCETDMNIVMTASGKFVEVQGTAEKEPFSLEHLNALITCAQSALKVVVKEQRNCLDSLK